MDNNYLLLVGIAYLFVALIDLVHTLAYKGMSIFVGYGANLATQLWIAARYLQSASLLAAPFAIGRKIKVAWILLCCAILTMLVFVLIFALDVFPVCYVEGVGLTGFKKSSEYIISAIFIGAAAGLWLKRGHFDRRVLRFLIASILVAVFSELSFTLYKDVYGLANQTGHFLKLASFYLLYKAALETGIREPYAVLLHNLNQSKEQLVREMAKTRNYLDVAGVIMVVVDASEKVTLINKKGCEILGRTREQIIGKNWFDTFLPKQEREKSRKIFKELMGGNTAATEYFENLIVNDNGDERIIAWHNSPLKDADGNITAILSSGEDITEQKHAQEQIRQHEEMLETTLESLTHPFYVVDVNDYSVKTANSAAWQYAENHETVKCYGLSHKGTEPCGTEEHPCPLEIVKQTKEPTTVEHVHYDKNGNKHHVEIHAYPVFDNQGNVKEVIEYCVDVTERKLVEQQVESLAKFPSEDPNPVLRISKDGTVLYANTAGTELLQEWNCEVGGHAPQAWHQYVSRILISGSSETLEHTSGLRVFSLTIAPVAGAGYVNVYGTDITERKQFEDDLNKYREHLEELVHERTEELTDANIKLTAEIERRKKLEREILNISEQEQRRLGQELHDSLGQHLTGISFMARVLENKLKKKKIEEAKSVAEIAKLVTEATNQARGLAKGLHPVDLDSGSLISSLHELAASTQHLFGIHCTFRYDKLITMSNSESAVHLYRIAQEAVTNAIKHGRTKNIEIRLESAEDNAVLTVENDGRDFPKEYEVRGTGMGLQIMDHRVDLIGGTLKIRKGPKGGTIVSCTFPLKNC
jgi:PAS domain S-box-containing protein